MAFVAINDTHGIDPRYYAGHPIHVDVTQTPEDLIQGPHHSEPILAILLMWVVCVLLGSLFVYSGYQLEEPFFFAYGFLVGASIGHQIKHSSDWEMDIDIDRFGIHFYLPSLILGLALGSIAVWLRYIMKSLACGVIAVLLVRAFLRGASFRVGSPETTHAVELLIYILICAAAVKWGGRYLSYAMAVLSATVGAFFLAWSVNLIFCLFREPLVHTDIMEACNLAMDSNLNYVISRGLDRMLFYGCWLFFIISGTVSQVKDIRGTYNDPHRYELHPDF